MSKSASPYRPLSSAIEAEERTERPDVVDRSKDGEKDDGDRTDAPPVKRRGTPSCFDAAATAFAAVKSESGCRLSCSAPTHVKSVNNAATTVSMAALVVAGLAVTLAGVLAIGVLRLGERVSMLEDLQNQHHLHHHQQQQELSDKSMQIDKRRNVRSSTQEVDDSIFESTYPDVSANGSDFSSAAAKLAIGNSSLLTSGSTTALMYSKDAVMEASSVNSIDDWTSERIAVLIEVKIPYR